jgi:predicted nucleic acid-binding protein
MSGQRFLLDTNTLIAPHRRYYRFTFCPGFWHFMQLQFDSGETFSIIKVYEEIVKNKDTLSDWLKAEADKKLFVDTTKDAVTMAKYDEVTSWVFGNDQFQDSAKRDFLGVEEADPWICAHAAAHRATVVTEEVKRPDARNRVSLANVLEQFEVHYMNLFEYLELQKAQFILSL